jgi:hypothetical protein
MCDQPWKEFRVRNSTGWFITGVSLLLAGCAGGGAGNGSQSGDCAGGRCAGVCEDEVKAYVEERLGTEATEIRFSFGNDDPGRPSTSVVYFRTKDCIYGGEYQAEFFGTAESCSNEFRGTLPKYLGRLLVVPEDCPG